MENLDLVQQMVTAAATRLKVPVSVKIRLFPELQTTIDYALMLQQAGASLLAIHGRTRDMKVCVGACDLRQGVGVMCVWGGGGGGGGGGAEQGNGEGGFS